MKLYSREPTSTFIILSVLILTISCSGESESGSKENETNIYSGLVGEWSNIDMHLVLHNDEDSIVDLTLDNWVDVLGIRPILTEFRADSTYVSQYFDPEGQLLTSSTGSWYVIADSLYMLEREVPARYFVALRGDTVLFRSYLDWDQDGSEDDLYEGRQVRQ